MSLTGDSTSVPERPDNLRHLGVWPFEHPKSVSRGYVVLVETRTGHLRRNLYLSLAAAQKAVERAQHRGVSCAVVLVELVPSSAPAVVVLGGESA